MLDSLLPSLSKLGILLSGISGRCVVVVEVVLVVVVALNGGGGLRLFEVDGSRRTPVFGEDVCEDHRGRFGLRVVLVVLVLVVVVVVVEVVVVLGGL